MVYAQSMRVNALPRILSTSIQHYLRALGDQSVEYGEQNDSGEKDLLAAEHILHFRRRHIFVFLGTIVVNRDRRSDSNGEKELYDCARLKGTLVIVNQCKEHLGKK